MFARVCVHACVHIYSGTRPLSECWNYRHVPPCPSTETRPEPQLCDFNLHRTLIKDYITMIFLGNELKKRKSNI